MPTLATDGVRVEYSELGRGDPVVLVHSASGTGGQWRTPAETLKDAYRLLAVNLHGIGETQPWRGPGHMGIDDDASLVRAVGTASGVPFHLVGHSYGGAVAIRVALLSPSHLQSLTLIEPMGYPLLREAGEDALYTETVSVVEPFLAASMRAGAEAAWRQGTDRYHGAGAWAALPDSTRAAFLARTPVVVERCHAMLSNPTLADDCRQLAVRTLVLCGARTGEPERRLSEIVAGLISGCSFSLVEGAGHMSPLTHPSVVAAMIRAHLSSARSDAAGAPNQHASAARGLALLALRPLSVDVILGRHRDSG
jgi:pimeloyl-ACP methyl ester carboxylesterase